MAKMDAPVMLALDKISPKSAASQPLDRDALAMWAESVKRNGLRSPLLVRPLGEDTYQMVLEDHKWHAARLAGLTEVPAIVWEMTEDELSEVALAEVLTRWELSQD